MSYIKYMSILVIFLSTLLAGTAIDRMISDNTAQKELSMCEETKSMYEMSAHECEGKLSDTLLWCVEECRCDFR